MSMNKSVIPLQAIVANHAF